MTTQRKVIKYHPRIHSWIWDVELECGHWVTHKTYTLRRYKTMNCSVCYKAETDETIAQLEAALEKGESDE
jgi:hypothetical protein